jgi:Trypsin
LRGCTFLAASIIALSLGWLSFREAAAQRGPGQTGVRKEILDRARQRLDQDSGHKSQLIEAMEAVPLPRIFGGRPVPGGYFRDAVAIYRDPNLFTSWLCSGVLVGKEAVLTAVHCVCELRSSTGVDTGAVQFGPNVQRPGADLLQAARLIPIERTVLYDPDFCEKRQKLGIARAGMDIALLLLRNSPLQVVQPGPAKFDGDETIMAPARLASTSLILSSVMQRLVIVGYGQTESGRVGQKFYAQAEIASRICGTELDRYYFGCHAGTEIVLAGRYGEDTCRGDSGGPAYAVVGSDYYLVGVTSRAIDARGSCGGGGVYTLITPRIVNWLRAWGVGAYAFE